MRVLETALPAFRRAAEHFEVRAVVARSAREEVSEAPQESSNKGAFAGFIDKTVATLGSVLEDVTTLEVHTSSSS